MEKYYKLAEEKVINTVTHIPKTMWKRKNILPFERIIKTEYAGEVSEDKNIDIQKDKVIETITKYKITPTLEKIKIKKIREIKSSCEMEILDKHSLLNQSLASLGILPIQKVQEMKDFIQIQLDKRNLLVNQVNSQESINEVNLINWA